MKLKSKSGFTLVSIIVCAAVLMYLFYYLMNAYVLGPEEGYTSVDEVLELDANTLRSSPKKSVLTSAIKKIDGAQQTYLDRANDVMK